jgi:hypothetical protein
MRFSVWVLTGRLYVSTLFISRRNTSYKYKHGPFDRISTVILLVVVGIFYMTVQIRGIATVIICFIVAILLMMSEVGFSPL